VFAVLVEQLRAEDRAHAERIGEHSDTNEDDDF